jgi:hypothetical protein
VHYEGDLVVHDGSLYQCIKDSGHPPPHEDWVCVARAGRDGLTPRVCGTWAPDDRYRTLDVVALNGASFIARKDDPGVCPGEDWQALTLQGKRGIAGPKGDRGEKGQPGSPAPVIAGWIIEKESYTVIPVLFGGAHGPRLDLRPLIEHAAKYGII